MSKTILLFFVLLSGTAKSFAQVPEKIYGKNKVLKTNDYYLQQMELWRKEVDKDPKNADAWFNYYFASRDAYIVGEEKRTMEGKTTARFERLAAIVDNMEKNIPGSFEYNYIKWANGFHDEKLLPYLEKARQLAPQRTEPLMDLALYYEMKGNYAEKNKNAKAYYDSGEYSPGLLTYSYNMLSGLDKNAIIITEGDKDTEGTWLLQAAKNIRTDVKLLNINFLYIKEYRERIFSELGIPQLDYDPVKTDAGYAEFNATVIELVAKNAGGFPVYAGSTLSKTYTDSVKDRLYINGLSYLYSTTPVDSFALLRKNLEQVYLMDDLKVYLPHDISEGNVHFFNLNYMPALAVLSADYAKAGDRVKALCYEELACKVATDAGSMDVFENYFGNQ